MKRKNVNIGHAEQYRTSLSTASDGSQLLKCYWTNKLDVGDFVKLRDDLVPYTSYNGLVFVPEMEIYKGKIYQITRHIWVTNIKRCWLDNIPWEFSEQMLELIPLTEKELKMMKKTKNLEERKLEEMRIKAKEDAKCKGWDEVKDKTTYEQV